MNLLELILWAFRWSTLLVSICYESINNSVSIFHTRLLLTSSFLSSFSLTVFKKFFHTQKKKSSTNLNHKEKKTRGSNYRLKYCDFPRSNYVGDKSSGPIVRAIVRTPSQSIKIFANCCRIFKVSVSYCVTCIC